MGYIKLDRKITEWEWYRNVNTKTVFLHCLFKANWKDGRFEGVVIPRGSFATSLPTLSRECNLTVQNVRTALEHLKSTGELTVHRHGNFSVVTVTNYCQYQDTNTETNRPSTDFQQTSNSPLTTIEEGKKERKKKEYIGAFKISENETLQSAFNDFIEMRKAIKKPMTERAAKNIAEKLKRMSPDEYVQADILDQSITNSWQDVYPLRNGFVSTRVRPQRTDVKEEKEHVMSDEEWAAMYEPGGKMFIGAGDSG